MFYKYSLYITLLCAGLPRTSHSTNTTKESVRASRSLHLEHAAVSLAYVRRDSLVKQPVTPPPGPPGLAGSACLETCTRVALCVSTGLLTAVLTQPLPAHTPSIAFRHLSPNSARFGYATEGALFISAQLSTDAVSAFRRVWVINNFGFTCAGVSNVDSYKRNV